MSKIARYQGNLRAFGSNAEGLERTLFGETAQADDLTSQVTAAFLRGWGIVGASEHPSLEDFNGAMFAMTQFLAYQHQVGVPEWHAQQEYYVGSICTHKGESYQSLIDGNVGNEPPSTKWTPILTSKNGLQNLGLGEAAKRGVGTGDNQLPDMSSFASSIGALSGWYKQPNGVIVQYGYSTSASGNAVSTPVTFPIPFPTYCIGVLATIDRNDGISPDNLSVYTGNRSNTGFNMIMDASSSVVGGRTAYWEAKGK
ncbi:carbohydrate-binding protein [Kluyvera intermedia]|uniref:gp53-like domain-containing protein n=1 Tax=Kluyvera intermedia TaxID=61648 RepID=UPI0039F4934E